MWCVTFFVLFFFADGLCRTDKYPCEKWLTVDISDGNLQLDNSNSIFINNTVYDTNNYYIDEENRTLGCICNIKPCIQKCCGRNQQLVDNNCTITNNEMQFKFYEGEQPVASSNHSFHILYSSLQCPDGFQSIQHEGNFYLQKSGSLMTDNLSDMKGFTEFCLESFKDTETGTETINPVICFKVEDDKTFFLQIGIMISIPFLLATFLVFACLPDRNLHIKALMFYVMSLMISYIILIVIQNVEFESGADIWCKLAGYTCLLFLLISFFWLNVISIEIWSTFSGLRGFYKRKLVKENKRFLFYCGYACGAPTLLILTVVAIDTNTDSSKWYHSQIGIRSCFLEGTGSILLYLYGPIAVLMTINIISFIITALKINSIKQATSVLTKEDNKKHEKNKEIFNLYWKLLFAMGINWFTEIISWGVQQAVNVSALWYLTDFCNAAYGVFIFFFFVFKKSIWKVLKKRYYSFGEKHYSRYSTTGTRFSKSLSFLSSRTTINDNPRRSSSVNSAF